MCRYYTFLIVFAGYIEDIYVFLMVDNLRFLSNNVNSFVHLKNVLKCFNI